MPDDVLSESMIFFMNPGFVLKGLERLSSGDRVEAVVVMGGEERKVDPFGTVPTNILTPQQGMKADTYRSKKTIVRNERIWLGMKTAFVS